MPFKDPVLEAEYQRAYRERNKARMKEQNRAWREANAEKLKADKRRDYEQNTETYKARARLHWATNKDHYNAIRRTPEYKENRKALRAAEWKRLEYWQQKYHQGLSQAYAKGATIRDTDSLKAFYRQVFTLSEYRCDYCFGFFPIKQITADHKEPYALGGEHSVSNLAVSCLTCNIKKGARPYATWNAL